MHYGASWAKCHFGASPLERRVWRQPVIQCDQERSVRHSVRRAGCRPRPEDIADAPFPSEPRDRYGTFTPVGLTVNPVSAARRERLLPPRDRMAVSG